MKEHREDIEEQVIKSIFEYVRKNAEPPSSFTVVRKITSTDSYKHHHNDTKQWLYDLEQDAINDSIKVHYWVNLLRGFVRGLRAAEWIRQEVLEELDEILDKNDLSL